MNPAIGDILHTEEIKEIIAKLVEVDIEGYGSKLWFKQDENLQKLNMQTHVNAIMKTDEFIMDECVSQDKLKLLIYDLVVSEAWKRKVLPLLKNQYAQMNTFRSYIAVYHEAVVANLLEILLYYNTAVMESGDLLVDVIDWAYDKLVRQIGKEMQKLKRRPDKKEELTP
jgi:ribosome-associated translation inhibitor RaiA